ASSTGYHHVSGGPPAGSSMAKPSGMSTAAAPKPAAPPPPPKDVNGHDRKFILRIQGAVVRTPRSQGGVSRSGTPKGGSTTPKAVQLLDGGISPKALVSPTPLVAGSTGSPATSTPPPCFYIEYTTSLGGGNMWETPVGSRSLPLAISGFADAPQ
ncbi:unnamed protein product, partial [Amoebophrya sp. A25]